VEQAVLRSVVVESLLNRVVVVEPPQHCFSRKFDDSLGVVSQLFRQFALNPKNIVGKGIRLWEKALASIIILAN
jgi:hypothetical protein